MDQFWGSSGDGFRMGQTHFGYKRRRPSLFGTLSVLCCKPCRCNNRSRYLTNGCGRIQRPCVFAQPSLTSILGRTGALGTRSLTKFWSNSVPTNGLDLEFDARSSNPVLSVGHCVLHFWHRSHRSIWNLDGAFTFISLIISRVSMEGKGCVL